MSTKKQDEAARLQQQHVRKSPRLRTRSSKAIEALARKDLSFKPSPSQPDAVERSRKLQRETNHSASNESDDSVTRLRRRKRSPGMPSTSTSLTTEERTNAQTDVDAKMEKASEACNSDDDNEDHDCFEKKDLPTKRPRSRQSMLDKLQPSEGFVSKMDTSAAPEDTIPMRRRPRMASLNAIAKVNAVLDCYTTGPRSHSDTKRIDKADNDGKEFAGKRRRRSSSTQSTEEQSRDESLCMLTVVAEHNQPISDSCVSSTNMSLPELIVTGTFGVEDKAVQTDANHKAVQTDDTMREARCTCGNKLLSSYGNAEQESIIAIPVSSLIESNASTHELLIPFTKTHLLSNTSLRNAANFPNEVLHAKGSNIAKSLQDIAVNNALIIAKKPHAYWKGSNIKSMFYHKSDGGCQAVSLKVPKINFAATSTSTFSAFPKTKVFHPVKTIIGRKGNTVKDQGKKDGDGWTKKMVNGWMFGGDPVEKTFAYDDCVVTRRYYTCMKRSNEVLNIRDSVLLKSGTRKKDLPYVARVAAIWEEEEGPNSGDMMVSVFWYYRPEQTEVERIPGFHGNMEVLASKHRDDNSVACIVDKCYVLSYPQYCRFRAKSCLYRESRKKPLSLVPAGESTRPGSMPPPNIDPSLVFFGRQVYDFKSGRVLKSVS